MKKAIIAIVAIFYLAVSSGFTVHMHYCMNKLAGWDLLRLDKDVCGICGMHKGDTKGCCKDEHKVVKFSHDQKTGNNIVVKIRPWSQVISLAIQVEFTPAVSPSGCKELYNLPVPHFRSTQVFLRNCNFRI